MRRIQGIGLVLPSLLLAGRLASAQTVQVLHEFGPEGGSPQSALLEVEGVFWGTTSAGGDSGQGSIFTLTPDGTGGFTFRTEHAFQGPDGTAPVASLIRSNDGDVYGATTAGGANGLGTIFRIDGDGKLTTLHEFAGPDGATPAAALLQAADGRLYGTTFAGGANGLGTAFRIAPDGSLATLHDFSASDGSNPRGTLVEGSDGVLYATASPDYVTLCDYPVGDQGCGSMFRMDTQGGLTTVVGDFGLGRHPFSGVILGSDGLFYGATFTRFDVGDAGIWDNGEIFRADTKGNVTVLHDFGTTNAFDGDPELPASPFLQARDGTLYFATALGPAGAGILYRMKPDGELTSLHQFSGTDGEIPNVPLVQGSDGAFYGATLAGGKAGTGVVYRLGCVVPVLSAPKSAAPGSTGLAASVENHPGSTYAWTLTGGTISSGQGASGITFISPDAPGSSMDLKVAESRSFCTSPPGKLRIPVDFLDVVPSNPFHRVVDALASSGAAGGCGGGNFCASAIVSRGEAAVAMSRLLAGGDASVPSSGDVQGVPYDCSSGGVSLYADVVPSDPSCRHVHYLAAQKVTAGCASGLYCPDAPMTRVAMAAFTARALVAPAGGAGVPVSFGPDPVSYFCVNAPYFTHFSDAGAGYPFCKHVHYLWALGVITGCGPTSFCPAALVTRDVMAKFLVNAFHIDPSRQ